ncbi:MAG TPA: hypothetical protein VEH52_09390 [Gaiellaceae bacterium]|jgi:hypothetical protein|nr:hypothetical protein [Gaiellaceae bacterium]
MIENDIRTLLAAPATGDDAPTVDQLEYVLTSGYARSMEIEAERWRIERRIADVAMGLVEGSPDGGTAELKSLAAKLRSADGDLHELRELLVSLRRRAEAARAAA